MDRFPTVEALAAATPADVLRAWQGLGYNRRALNLWRAARRIVDEHGGRVPDRSWPTSRRCRASGRTPRGPSRRSRSGCRSARSTRTCAASSGGSSPATPALLRPVEMQRLADAAVPVDRAGRLDPCRDGRRARRCAGRARRDCAACPAQPWCRYAGDAADGDRRQPIAARRALPGSAPLRSRPPRAGSAAASSTVSARPATANGSSFDASIGAT